MQTEKNEACFLSFFLQNSVVCHVSLHIDGTRCALVDAGGGIRYLLQLKKGGVAKAKALRVKERKRRSVLQSARADGDGTR